jgi:hypothetical protein
MSLSENHRAIKANVKTNFSGEFEMNRISESNDAGKLIHSKPPPFYLRQGGGSWIIISRSTSAKRFVH